jgi:hypothetical protein
MTARTEALKSAGFPVRWAYRPDGEGQDYITWSDLQDYPAEGYEPYADLSSVAKGEDAANQTSTVDRSNYRSLHRDYPEVWTDTSYVNVNALGAFVDDLTDDLVEILTGLREQCPLYSDDDHSELESEEIAESWEQYVRYDIGSEIRRVMPDEGDQWDALSDDEQRDMFWSAVQESDDLYPEHDGLDIRWQYDAIASAIADRLASH